MAVFVAPSVSHAEERDVGSYTPDDPSTPTLAGTTAEPVCHVNVPWIYFDVILTDPDGQHMGDPAVLFITDGINSVDIALGSLVNGRLEGRVLWPGASLDQNGAADAWPGWKLENGQWVETTGNFAWTRGDITAEIRVNPSVSVPLTYPPVPSLCATPPSVTGLPSALSATGLNASLMPIAVAGGAILLIGGAFLVVQRRRTRA